MPASRKTPVQPLGCLHGYVALFSLFGTLAGCTHYEAAPLDPGRSAAAFEARRLGEGPPHSWDRAELLAVALTQNPQLAVSRAEVDAALSHEVTAAQSANPDVTLQSEYARHDPHPWLYGISLNWLLRSPERRRLDIEIAKLDTGNAGLQLMDQAWDVRSTLTAALSDWESGRRRLELLTKLAQAQDRMLAFEKQRVGAGEDAPSDLLAIQQARIQTEQEESELRAAVDAAQAAAAKSLGLPPQALDGVALAWQDWGDPPVIDENARRGAREQALLSRADLARAIGEYSSWEAKYQLAVARQYPQLELSPGYYWDHGIAKFPFDVGFSLPLNGNKGEIAEARAGRELAGRRMLAVQADIYGEIVAAERAERIARSGAEAAARQLDAARHQRQSADLGFRLGATDAAEQAAADILALRAELALVQMRAHLQTSRNTLEDVLHAPLSGPELALAKSLTSMVAGAGS